MVPKIKINGKTYIATAPKAKIWREIVKFDENRTQENTVDFIDKHAEMIAKVFDNSEVTAESVLDNLGLDEIVPKYFEVFKWICELINSKLQQLPNESTPTAE